MREDVSYWILKLTGQDEWTGKMIKTGGKPALISLASKEIKDETIKARFIEKMNEHPISDAPDEIDLIKIKDYYKQN